MSTRITADNGIEITVGLLAIEVTDPEYTPGIYARLTDAQRVELAAALDPGRRGLHVRLDNQAATLATYQRELDEAVARAKQLEREVSKVEGRASEWSIKAQQWRERAEAAETRTAVTRDDIDRALINVTSNAMNYPTPSQMLGKDTGPLRRKCVDAVCDLFGVEAEQATDPVEQKARELFDVANADALIDWERTSEGMRGQYRRLAAHVLGQEATR